MNYDIAIGTKHSLAIKNYISWHEYFNQMYYIFVHPYAIALISHASKVMLKILQARLQQYLNRELPDVQAGFRKGRGTTRVPGSMPGQETRSYVL